jgi:hypothetical protein
MDCTLFNIMAGENVYEDQAQRTLDLANLNQRVLKFANHAFPETGFK